MQWVQHYVEAEDDTEWALTLDTAEGAVLDSLHRARLSTRVQLLDSATVVDSYRRRFAELDGTRQLPDDEVERVKAAFERYLDTVPDRKKEGVVMFDVLDVIGRKGFGIGSAGLPAYNVLIEGFSQALDNDVVLTLKQGNVAAPSRIVRDAEVAGYFEHHGHRTAREPARTAGARRPFPGLDRAARHRRTEDGIRGKRVLPVRSGPGLERRRRA